MRYEEAISYIYSFVDYEKLSSPSYEKKERYPLRFKAFLKDIGSPEESFPVIHITGTKGKGSVAVMLTNILKEAGMTVGTYTSPHLIDVRERIMLNGRPIPKEEFLDLFIQILPYLEKRKKDRTYRTVFEILTALAFLYFKKQKVDIGVIEVGLGGKLDATNVFKKSTAVITNISLDHINILGHSLREIADDKSEIIKENSLVVSGRQKEEVLELIQNKTLQRHCKFLYTGDFAYTIKHKDESHTIFDLQTIFASYKGLNLSLAGSFQVENALTVVGVIEGLKDTQSHSAKFKSINEGTIKRGLCSVVWRGRLELLDRDPYLVVDGAHNPYSMEVISRDIKDIFSYRRLILIFGVNRDKQIKQMLDAIVPISDEIIATRIDFPRSAEPKLIGNMLKERSVKVTPNIGEALKMAYEIAAPDDLILITGSLYLVGDAIREVERK